MNERRKPLARRLEKASMNPKEPISRLQKDVTAWMKVNVPTKKTKFLHSHVVEYFIGKKAVDMLMEESPWAYDPHAMDKEEEAGRFMFKSREQCVEMLDGLLRYKMFHRARKIPVADEKDKKNKRKDKSDSEADREEKEGESVGEAVAVEGAAAESGRKVSSGGETEAEEKPKKRRIRLDMHLEQVFVDNSDAFVWLYDPIPWYYWLAGGAIVLLVIGLCLFPLWPRKIRRGAHWVAFLAACFMVGVLVAAILKYVLFALFYGLSAGKLRFWILPNLTEDVDFLNSFWPLYGYTYTGEVRRETEGEDEGEVNNSTRQPKGEDSDSNESSRSGFEFIDKSKDV